MTIALHKIGAHRDRGSKSIPVCHETADHAVETLAHARPIVGFEPPVSFVDGVMTQLLIAQGRRNSSSKRVRIDILSADHSSAHFIKNRHRRHQHGYPTRHRDTNGAACRLPRITVRQDHQIALVEERE